MHVRNICLLFSQHQLLIVREVELLCHINTEDYNSEFEFKHIV